jgi:hypothetical protein
MIITKVEHHSVNWHYQAEIDEDLLAEIYPDLDDEEIDEILDELNSGERVIDGIIEAARENDVDIDWSLDFEDVWTDRKGGYDITYEIESE